MKQKIILFIAFVFVVFNANAQSKKDFEKAIDYCACKIAYAYTNQYSNKKPSSQEAKSFNEKIKPKIEKCDIDSPMDYSELIELLKSNNYKTFSNKFLPPSSVSFFHILGKRFSISRGIKPAKKALRAYCVAVGSIA